MGPNLKYACGLLIAILPTVVVAQSPVERAQERYRLGMIDAYERALFNATKKTTTIIYVKQYLTENDKLNLICGEAFFGSTRDNFFIDYDQGQIVAAAMRVPREKLREVGCNTKGGETLIDLR